MSTTKETTAPSTKDIPEPIRELAGKYKTAFKITATGLTEVEADIYARTLPEGMTMEQVLALQKHDRNVVPAVRLALGELAIPFLAKHPKVDQVTVEFAGGQNMFGEVFSREKQVPDGKGGMQTKYGHTRSFFEASADQDKSALARVNSHLATLSAAALGKTK